jgi:hypothetical protein
MFVALWYTIFCPIARMSCGNPSGADSSLNVHITQTHTDRAETILLIPNLGTWWTSSFTLRPLNPEGQHPPTLLEWRVSRSTVSPSALEKKGIASLCRQLYVDSTLGVGKPLFSSQVSVDLR